VIVRDVRELVDLILGDLEPVTGALVRTDVQTKQLECLRRRFAHPADPRSRLLSVLWGVAHGRRAEPRQGDEEGGEGDARSGDERGAVPVNRRAERQRPGLRAGQVPRCSGRQGVSGRRGGAAVADVPVTLDVTSGVPHVFQGFAAVLDEGGAALDRASDFLNTQFAAN
jgi:hypothetical protein